MKLEGRAHSRPGSAAVASYAALSYEKPSDSNRGFCENEQATSSTAYYEWAVFLAVAGLCAIAQNWV
jgi:hypothetical protein